MGTAGSSVDARGQCRQRLLPTEALDLELEIFKTDAQFAAGVAAADTNSVRGRVDVTARCTPGRAVGIYGKRGDSRSRQQIEQQENFLSICSVRIQVIYPRAGTHRATPASRSAARASIVSAGASAGNSASGSADGCSKCRDRRGTCRLFSSDLFERGRWLPEFCIEQLVQRTRWRVELWRAH